jgi:hypothetical protein
MQVAVERQMSLCQAVLGLTPLPGEPDQIELLAAAIHPDQGSGSPAVRYSPGF